MADPFSITTVIIEALKVAGGLHGLIVSLRKVPNELLALSNETCNLKFVLDSIQETVQQGGETGAAVRERVGPLLFQARGKLDQLNNLVAKWGKTNIWGDKVTVRPFDRIACLKEKSAVWELQKQLREIRSNLSVILESSSLSINTRLSVEIQDLYAETTRVYKSQIDVSEQVADLGKISRESVNLLHELIKRLDHYPTRSWLGSDVTLEVDQMDEIGSNKSGEAEIPHTRVRFDIPGQGTPEEAPLPPQVLVLPVSRSTGKQVSCESPCHCACHRRHALRTIPVLQQLVGRLFIGYSGLSVRRQQCNLSTCQQRETRETTITYFFPRWFVDRALSVAFSQSMGTPTLNLKLRRSCSETDRLFMLSRCEGVEGTKEMFSARAASPDDIDHRGGWTPLPFAVDHGCLEVCRLLLNEGANPEWEDNTGTSALEVAWRNILHLKAPPHLAEAFSVLFPGSDFLEQRQFTHIHKLIIGLEKGSLEEELQRGESEVNARDANGWTPLHWAARRGNSDAVAILLAHGADPFLLTDNDNRSPLHLAAQSSSALCIKQLLQFRHGNRILNIDLKDGYGCTPLRVAAQYNNTATAAYLIKAGADLNEGEEYGEGPLLSAVAENNVETATLLIRAGAALNVKTHAGNTVLHLAANVGTIPMLNILTKARLRDVDLEARNSDGHTPAEKAVLRGKDDAPEGFQQAWDRLVRSIEDDEFEPGSWATTPLSGNESWHSFEEMHWFEAEAVVAEDVWRAEMEAQMEAQMEASGDYTTPPPPRVSRGNLYGRTDDKVGKCCSSGYVSGCMLRGTERHVISLFKVGAGICVFGGHDLTP
ncbi:hypothetical protein QBC40DRAFT_271721 [Triangularia verruculosa]|uniref:Uncharacterized protein n=1 Tax=Triangularia verruculosa TaxID=2587418 RepID=A0AAN6XQV2_9PEZI|nr:hypothetical protein QBC40DRAFT_271721 [Triangularia verruculosa]